jgi:hypothetical protein
VCFNERSQQEVQSVRPYVCLFFRLYVRRYVRPSYHVGEINQMLNVYLYAIKFCLRLQKKTHFVCFVFQESVRHADGHLRQGPDRPVLPAHSQALDEPDLSGKRLSYVESG